MRVRHVKITDQPEQSYQLTQEVVPYFYNPLHFHEKIELTYITQSYGTAFIGDYIGKFEAGDIFLIGEKVPHDFKNAPEFFQKDSLLQAEAIVLHFDEAFLGNEFWSKPEMSNISKLLFDARKGIKITEEIKPNVQTMIKQIKSLSHVSQLLSIVSILDLVSKSSNNEVLSSSLPRSNFNFMDAEKLNKINSYTLAHFQERITLDTIASIANMNPSAFCRYFKSRTKRSFSQFLLELRLQHATGLLINSTLTIEQISYESGFESPSYFYRTFKKHKKITPAAYQKSLRLS